MDTSVCRSGDAITVCKYGSLVAMVIVLLYQAWQISPCCLVARQPSIIMNKNFRPVFRMGIIMLYRTIIIVNVLRLFFQMYNIEGVENKH